ncbi:helix-turn-helix domain-containing protein [Nocardiopsis trehalosi]|uniref:helix-turn-helix domain-containing protein n=1 Tax=Nocardiopsis trehalosi TaxID=109329 RepID=UPI0008337551|nr:helix-turn-helix domain-containing protein [Nocardiopsis trehalosi]
MAQHRLDTALPAGTDPRAHAHLLHRVHEATFSGGTPPAPPRSVIAESWGRMRTRRFDPDDAPRPRLLRREEVERRRAQSPLGQVLPLLRSSLTSVAEDAGHVMLVTDHTGLVLWRDGPARVRRIADGAGLVEGAYWNEENTGTNAIGTALVVGRAVQVHSAEHYVRPLHRLTCACAPVRDPRDGRVIGAIDLTGPAITAHPSTLGLVDAVARLAESQLRGLHHAHLERLRVVTAPILAGLRGPALVVDDEGWTAAAVHTEPVRRVLLPKRPEAGTAWLPVLGACRLEPLPGGWLVRPGAGEAAPPTHAELDLATGSVPLLRVGGPSGEWTHRPSPRHTELLLLLARHPEGRTAAQLAQDLFGDQGRVGTVRAEMSRLRRHLGGVVESRPYRFAEGLSVSVRTPADPVPLIRTSTAPAIRRPAAPTPAPAL